MKESVIGQESSLDLFEAARRELRGELDFPINEAVHKQIEWTDNDGGEFADAVKFLNREKIIEAAVNQFKESYTEILNQALDKLVEEFDV